MIKPGITLLGLLTFTLCFTFGQKSNIVPSENFPQAKSNLDLVKNLELPQEPVLSYTQDVVYVKRGDLDLHIQLVAPRRDPQTSKEQKGFPCIIYIQGSAWKKQNVYVGIPQLAKFASRGFVIASAEYRHSERAPFPAQVQDTKTAIRFMRKNAEKLSFATRPEKKTVGAVLDTQQVATVPRRQAANTTARGTKFFLVCSQMESTVNNTTRKNTSTSSGLSSLRFCTISPFMNSPLTSATSKA